LARERAPPEKNKRKGWVIKGGHGLKEGHLQHTRARKGEKGSTRRQKDRWFEGGSSRMHKCKGWVKWG